MVSARALRTLVFLSLVILAIPLSAQQTGSISGKVTATDGSALPGATVEARSNVLPTPRVTTSSGNGDYRLPALPPGNYTVQFSLSGMQTVTRKAEVLLSQDIALDAKLGVQALSESVTVTAQASLVDKTSTALQSGLSTQQIQSLPVEQNYSDLQKLIPGVQYSQAVSRGPSAGASGQDNVYLFDGVNVTMPLFGILVAEPATHDIAQVSVVKGGAKAVDFDRAGGFLIDSVSKSGTSRFSGEVSYQMLSHTMVAPQAGTVNATYQQDRDWTTVNFGGPILHDRLFFYASYYRPIYTRNNQANFYGDLPSFRSSRNEEFGKLTYTPVQSMLINASYRNSHRLDTSGDNFSTNHSGTTGSGSEVNLKIGTLEVSKVINAKSFATLKFTDFRNPGFGRADNIANATVSTALGTHLDINNLDKIGRLIVPTAVPANAAFVQPFIDKYGYSSGGVQTGGGTVGFGQFAHDDDSFFRKSGQIGYNYILGNTVTHDLHVGYQRYNDSEDRFQTSNGWGLITIPGGVGAAGTCPANACGTSKPAFFVAAVSNQTTGTVPTIHSEFHSQAFELNDTIHLNNWTFNAGLMASNDTLFGQGLKAADNIAGFVASPGTKYKMHDFGFGQEIQPRLGATWAYDGKDTVYVSAARYNPAANSDARAASWDRNLVAQINAYFDASGNLIGFAPNASSSGKLFQAGIKPPEIKEYMIGTAQQLTNRWTARFYTRYRKGDHYMEDTNNTARIDFNSPAGIPKEPYIPNLGTVVPPTGLRGAIGSGSSYVIANLDGAFTKYYEATMESEWHGDRMFVRGSYTWSHYYGNFDQDNSTFSSANDAAVFIGSSNIGDGAGRQLWDHKYGNLRGDRRHLAKIYGTYILPWKATAGAFFVYQSGQPYQLESVLPYRPLTGSTSDTNRYAEPAGARVSPEHHQVDLNYTQNFPIPKGVNLQLVFDVYNVFNKQTGYDYETRIGVLGFTTRTDVPTVAIPSTIPLSVLTGLGIDPTKSRINAPYPNTFYAPRRFQLAARVQF
ncbi:MAG TPA: carboxypeptidase regulatory-like domain-containing protein [Thermoanaerobaculia bacterium]|nr:carboxypeptidase regulatory-like domain-containing protein [Thermoanaerobaculia bacterium]